MIDVRLNGQDSIHRTCLIRLESRTEHYGSVLGGGIKLAQALSVVCLCTSRAGYLVNAAIPIFFEFMFWALIDLCYFDLSFVIAVY